MSKERAIEIADELNEKLEAMKDLAAQALDLIKEADQCCHTHLAEAARMYHIQQIQTALDDDNDWMAASFRNTLAKDIESIRHNAEFADDEDFEE